MTSGLQRAIYEWTLTLPPWQRDLARRLSLNDRLSDDDVDEMIGLLLDDADRVQAQPLELDDLPSDDGAETPVELVAMGDMRNINCLAPGQRLDFGGGLTVVYGDTGSGKAVIHDCCVDPAAPSRRRQKRTRSRSLRSRRVWSRAISARC